MAYTNVDFRAKSIAECQAVIGDASNAFPAIAASGDWLALLATNSGFTPYTFADIDTIPWIYWTSNSSAAYYTNSADSSRKLVYTSGTIGITTPTNSYYLYTSGQLLVTNTNSGNYISIVNPKIWYLRPNGGVQINRWTNSSGYDCYSAIAPDGRNWSTSVAGGWTAKLGFGELQYSPTTGLKSMKFTNIQLTVWIWENSSTATIMQPAGVTNKLYTNGSRTFEDSVAIEDRFYNGDAIVAYRAGGKDKTSRNGRIVTCYDSNGEITNTSLTTNWSYTSASVETADFVVYFQPAEAAFVSNLLPGIDAGIFDPVHSFYNNYTRKAKAGIVLFATSNDFMEFFGGTNWMPGGFATGENLIAVSPLWTNWSTNTFYNLVQHEFSHNETLNFTRSGSVPSWLNEGIAQLVPINLDTNAYAYHLAGTNTYKAYTNATLNPWDTIATKSFGVFPKEQADIAYAQSLSLTGWLYATYGKDALMTLLGCFSNGMTVASNWNTAFTGVYGAFGTAESAWQSTLP